MKVLGVRTGRDLTATVAMPFLAPLIRTESEYVRRKVAAERVLTDFITRKGGAGFSPHVFLNVLDQPGAVGGSGRFRRGRTGQSRVWGHFTPPASQPKIKGSGVIS